MMHTYFRHSPRANLIILGIVLNLLIYLCHGKGLSAADSQTMDGSDGDSDGEEVLDLDTRIVGGHTVNAGDIPYQVGIFFGGTSRGSVPFCGGTLIEPEWVISAAHCFGVAGGRGKTSKSPSAYSIKLGAVNLQDPNDNEITVRISDIFVHPGYDDPPVTFDVSLIKLAEPITNMGEYINKASLPGNGERLPLGDNCTVSGWGSLESGTSSVSTLHSVDVKLLPGSDCSGLEGFNASQMICAGYNRGGKDACQGDSGGPLVCSNNDENILAGIVSYGYECALPNYPGVYTKVSAFLGWIYGVMNNN